MFNETHTHKIASNKEINSKSYHLHVVTVLPDRKTMDLAPCNFFLQEYQVYTLQLSQNILLWVCYATSLVGTCLQTRLVPSCQLTLNTLWYSKTKRFELFSLLLPILCICVSLNISYMCSKSESSFMLTLLYMEELDVITTYICNGLHKSCKQSRKISW